MENATVNKVKSPEPNLVSNQKEKNPKREIKRPDVGVVSVPQISNTPLADTISISKQENPHTVYKLTNKTDSFLNLNNIASIGIIACAGYLTLPYLKIKGS